MYTHRQMYMSVKSQNPSRATTSHTVALIHNPVARHQPICKSMDTRPVHHLEFLFSSKLTQVQIYTAW